MRFLYAAVIAALLTSSAWATEYYVDNSCANNGDGLSDSCAASPGGAGRFNDLRQCDINMVAGDTCNIRAGSGAYYRDYLNDGRRDWSAGFNPYNSGTSGNPITYKGVTGSQPTICSGSDCNDYSTYTNHAIGTRGDGDESGLTVVESDYIVFDNLRIQGGLSVVGCTGCVIKNCNISDGWTFSNTQDAIPDTADGNWTGIRMDDGSSAITIQNNYIHDITLPSPDRGNGIKMYGGGGSIVEYNTIYNTNHSAIELKSVVTDTIIRYNLIINSAQTGGGAILGGSGGDGGDNTIHNNVIACYDDINDIGGIKMPTPQDSGTGLTTIYNNTIYGCKYGIWFDDGGYTSSLTVSGIVRDNYIEIRTGGESINEQLDPEPWSWNDIDYNIYQTARWWDSAGTYRTIADWRTRTGDEANSSVLDCNITTPGLTCTDAQCSNLDWNLINSSCETASSTGNYVGAYTTTVTCIGYGCSVSGSTPTATKITGTNMNGALIQ